VIVVEYFALLIVLKLIILARVVAQMEEHLPSKLKALSSNTGTGKKKIGNEIHVINSIVQMLASIFLTFYGPFCLLCFSFVLFLDYRF
jgi:hypothetical protein